MDGLVISFDIICFVAVGQTGNRFEFFRKDFNQHVVVGVFNERLTGSNDFICRFIRHKEAGIGFFLFVIKYIVKAVRKILKQKQIIIHIRRAVKSIFRHHNRQQALGAGGAAQIFRIVKQGFAVIGLLCFQKFIENIVSLLLFLCEFFIVKIVKLLSERIGTDVGDKCIDGILQINTSKVNGIKVNIIG